MKRIIEVSGKKEKKDWERSSWKSYRKPNSQQRPKNTSLMGAFHQLTLKFRLKISVRIAGLENCSREEWDSQVFRWKACVCVCMVWSQRQLEGLQALGMRKRLQPNAVTVWTTMWSLTHPCLTNSHWEEGSENFPKNSKEAELKMLKFKNNST